MPEPVVVSADGALAPPKPPTVLVAAFTAPAAFVVAVLTAGAAFAPVVAGAAFVVFAPLEALVVALPNSDTFT